MSGGHFNYQQDYINYIVEELESIVQNNDKTCDICEKEKAIQGYASWHYDCEAGYGYRPEIIEKFKEGIYQLKKAYIYARRIDWLLSSDDGEESFLARLSEQLSELGNAKD